MKKILLIIFSMFILINVNAEEKTELDEYAKNRVDSCITKPFTGNTITCGNTMDNLTEYIEYLSYSCVKDTLDQGYSMDLKDDILSYVSSSETSFVVSTASFCEHYRRCKINYYKYMKAISEIKEHSNDNTIDYASIYKKYFKDDEVTCLTNSQMYAEEAMTYAKDALVFGYDNYIEYTDDSAPDIPEPNVKIAEDDSKNKTDSSCEKKYGKDKITTVKTIIAAIRISLLVAGIVISIIKLLPILRDRYEGMITDIVKIVIVFVIILVIVLMIPLIVKLFGGSCFI